VQGRVSRFRDEAQIDIAKVDRADRSDVDLARFLPASRRDIDELEGFFEHLVREVYEAPLRGMLESMLADEVLRGQLRQAPCTLPAMAGAKGQRHHAYLGGLLEHTVAVGTTALELCTLHPSLDRDLLLASALAHDIGKCREFEYGAEISRSPEGAMLGHIELGLRLIDCHAPSALPRERRLALEHCVLTHHGAERGANERFASAEAVALFRLNALDASVKGAVEHGLGR
jgi:3'-5' exoribonuclease